MQSQPPHLTEHGQKVLDILRGLYGWSGRSVIAAQLGRKHLNNYDMSILDLLTAWGLIETRRVKSDSVRRHKWEYRFIEPEDRDTMPPDADT